MRYLLLLALAGCASYDVDAIRARRDEMSGAEILQACHASVIQVETHCPMAGPFDDGCDRSRVLLHEFCYPDKRVGCESALREQKAVCRLAGPLDGRCSYANKAVLVLCY